MIVTESDVMDIFREFGLLNLNVSSSDTVSEQVICEATSAEPISVLIELVQTLLDSIEFCEPPFGKGLLVGFAKPVNEKISRFIVKRRILSEAVTEESILN